MTRPLRLVAAILCTGAALQVREQTGAGLPFVTRDRRLALAAEREGFEVLDIGD